MSRAGPVDYKVAAIAAMYGYIDEALGTQQDRGHVAKKLGKQYLASYEQGRHDCRTYRTKSTERSGENNV